MTRQDNIERELFQRQLHDSDNAIFSLIRQELKRQQEGIELIASENLVSPAVLQAQGSILTNKYAEGYPSKRYYGGCEVVDVVESLAIERAKQLFSCNFANVQPHSGSQMNQEVFYALLSPGDSFMGMDLNAGGHLTHGSSVNVSGRWFNAIAYGVREEDDLIDMQQVAELAHRHRPKLIIAGGTSYSRFWDWAHFRAIADEIGAYLMVDMSHIAGLVAGGQHPSPIPHAHVVTTTTHKSLRGPRGGMILSNDEAIAKKIDSAVFPGFQGGPLMHVIAAKAVAFGEALQPSFKIYAENIVKNAKVLAKRLADNNMVIISGGTDNHLMVADLRPKAVTGLAASQALESVGIICNKNAIPRDPAKPFVTSGIRVGTPACTSRGFGEKEFIEVADLVSETIDRLAASGGSDDFAASQKEIKAKVCDLTSRFPIYAD